jgi:hypothetical protein
VDVIVAAFQKPWTSFDGEPTGESSDSTGKEPGWRYGFGPDVEISRAAIRKLRTHHIALVNRASAAETAGNTSEANNLRHEAEQIQECLDETTFMGRPRLAKTDERRAYDTIAAGLESAIASITASNPVIGDHLRNAVRHKGTEWTYSSDLDWKLGPAFHSTAGLKEYVCITEGRGKLERLATGEWRIERGGSTCVVPDMVGMKCIAALLRHRSRIPASSLRNPVQGDIESTRERTQRVLQEHVGSLAARVPGVTKHLDSDGHEDFSLWKMKEQELAEYVAKQTKRSLADAAHARKLGNACRYHELLADIVALEKACALVQRVREQLESLRAEDDKARSGVSHNIRAAIGSIAARSPEIGSHLRESIKCGREFVYAGFVQWDVSY